MALDKRTHSVLSSVIAGITKPFGGTRTCTTAIVMLQSRARDFANNDPMILTLDFVNLAGPSTLSNYWVKGEALNNGNSTECRQ